MRDPVFLLWPRLRASGRSLQAASGREVWQHLQSAACSLPSDPRPHACHNSSPRSVMRKLAPGGGSTHIRRRGAHAQSSEADADLAVFNRAVQLQEAGRSRAAAVGVPALSGLSAAKHRGALEPRGRLATARPLRRCDRRRTGRRWSFVPQQRASADEPGARLLQVGTLSPMPCRIRCRARSNPGHPNVLC